jgi:7,8-dihydroneopterin aldolase/epimerase/oxygenase
MHCQLILKKLRLDVKLGYLDDERALTQRVSVDIKLQFANKPVACTTDNLLDTLCYANLSCELQQFCNGRSFKLIESLAYQLYQFLKQKITEITTEKLTIFLCVTKKPPLVNLAQSSFSISD